MKVVRLHRTSHEPFSVETWMVSHVKYWTIIAPMPLPSVWITFPVNTASRTFVRLKEQSRLLLTLQMEVVRRWITTNSTQGKSMPLKIGFSEPLKFPHGCHQDVPPTTPADRSDLDST
jgi:hypothetical protein